MHDRVARHTIQVASRLVRQQNRRPVHQRARQSRTLLLAPSLAAQPNGARTTTIVIGSLALATATGFETRKYDPIDAVDKVSCRPDFAIGCYSGYLKPKDKEGIRADLHIPPDTPPIFLAHTSDDTESYGGSNAENSAFMYIALKRAGIPTELHIYATGDHDFGVRQNEKLPSSWTQLCLNWLRSQGLLKAGSSK